MKLFKTNTTKPRNAAKLSSAAAADQPGPGRSLTGMLLRLLALAVVPWVGGATSKASAQTTPPYVVYSQTLLSGSFNGAKGNYAANSRGDFFANDGNGHVLEYPANGGLPITLWTESGGYGVSGVSTDPFDNLYITRFSGPSGNNGTDSQMYEFPSTNGSYPAPYIYNASSPPGSCTPAVPATATTAASVANTGVCALGLYNGAAYYYWQPLDIAADGQGNTYMYSNYDNTYSSTSLGIFQCQLACNQQLPGNGASAYSKKLSKSITSMIADYAGNVYFTDQADVFVIPAGSPQTNNVPAIFDATFNNPYGVTIDASGNLYVSDAAGIWEIPAVETAGGAPCKGGADPCKPVDAAKFKLIPLNGVPGSLVSAAVDNRGNIIFSPSSGSGNSSTNLFKASLWSGTFPSAQIGASGSTALQFTVHFLSGTTLTGFQAVQGSAASTEFVVSPGTCAAGATFAADTTCTFTATFTPSGLGVRKGAVILTDATGTTTTTNLTGVGTGSGLTVDPGTATQIGSGFKKPAGVAVDGSGNVYVADATANNVQRYLAGGGAPLSIGTGLTVPTGVTVDGAGNVFIVNQSQGAGGGSVVEVPTVAGVLTNSAQRTIVSGLNLPTDIVADGAGNLYISATGSNQVLQLANAARIGNSAAMVVRGFGLKAPTGLAIDTNGNLYVADTGNDRVLQLGDGFQIGVGSGLSAPTGVAVDASGSVIVADGSGRIIRVPNESSGANAVGLNQADQQVLGSPLSYPYAVRLDSIGNLYATDSAAAVVYQLQRTTGAVDFGNWNVGTVTNAQSIVLSNSGNADVTIGNPPFTAVPAASQFSVALGAGSNACASGLFHSGYNCTVQSMFAPTANGVSTYPLVFRASAQNTSAPTVNLRGTGVMEGAASLNLIQTAPTTPTISYGQQIVISAKVSPVKPGATPTGFVVFTFNGQNQRPVKLDASGAASITFNGLSAGSNTLSAYYEGDANYASLVSALLPLNILQAGVMNVLTIVGDSATPLSAAPGNNFTLTATLTPAVVGVFTGTVNFVDTTTGTVLNMNPIRLGSPDPKTGLYVVSFAIQGSSASLGTPNPTFAKGGQVSGTIVAQYSGNTNYPATTSAAVSYIVSASTYTVTATSSTVTASQAVPAVINLNVTDYSNFQGAVALQCSGLPTNAYCIFRPASAQLIPAPGPLPNTQLTPLTILPVPVTLQIVVDQDPIPIKSSAILWVGALSMGILLFWRRRLTGAKFNLLSLAGLLCMTGLLVTGGCGSSAIGFPTPAGSYTVTITATATPLLNGNQPACQYQNCSLPPDPVTNPSINVVKVVPVSLTVN